MAFKTTLPKILQGGKLYNIADLLGQTMVANENTNLFRFPSQQKQIFAIEDFTKVSGQAYVYSAQNNTSIYEPGKTIPAAKGISAGKQLGLFKSLRYKGSKLAGAYFTRSNKLFYIPSIDGTNWYLSGWAYKKVNNLVATIKKGQPIGELWTWARGIKQTYNPADKRYSATLTDEFYLVFKYNGTPVYAKVTSNLIDTNSLAQQDIKTTEEQSQTLAEKIEHYGKVILIGGAVVLTVVGLGKAAIMASALTPRTK
jgi:hypothetical protein